MVTALNCDLDGLTDEAGRQVECSRLIADWISDSYSVPTQSLARTCPSVGSVALKPSSIEEQNTMD